MKLSEALWQDDERMSGAVCFRNTRVPVEFVFDFLANGKMNEFYDGYPNVKPEQVRAVVEASKELIESAFRVAA
jgi:uncharacterized protein (DUF433 family)